MGDIASGFILQPFIAALHVGVITVHYGIVSLFHGIIVKQTAGCLKNSPTIMNRTLNIMLHIFFLF